MSFQNILYETDGSLARITINRPEKRNALDRETYLEIGAALDSADRDDAVRVVVLTGSGDRVFASGADLAFVNKCTPMQYRAYLEANRSVRVKIRGLSKPVIARVNGVAYGGAMGLSTACDLIVASTNAKFAQREIAVGLLGGVAHLQSVGPARTAEIMFTGDPIDAAEAERIGLINRAVPPEDLDAAVQQYIDKLASKSPIGLKFSKQTLNLARDMGFAQAESYQFEMVLGTFVSEDRKEGMDAFLEKREPHFRGV